MSDPAAEAQGNEPQYTGQDEVQQRRKHAALDELSKAGKEEAAHGSDDVSG